MLIKVTRECTAQINMYLKFVHSENFPENTEIFNFSNLILLLFGKTIEELCTRFCVIVETASK